MATRLAVDVFLPEGRAADAKYPTLIELTRYWRAPENPESGEPFPSLDVWDQAFLSSGYAVVQLDVLDALRSPVNMRPLREWGQGE